MSIFKCKMCGGTIEFSEGASVGVCDYCGTKQTLPRLDNDKKANLYDRANHFRRNNDFDKAMSIYEQILNEDSTDAEAYWSLVLCRYGIEYVEDPQSHRRVPTVNRAQFTSVFADEDYKSALQYADANQREIYENEAKEIDDIQKGILAISQKEKPFDVFICYKETDVNGRRTQDSVLANDLYHQLTQEGFKVFFSRITLEDKLGTAYEPYIFAALNSAKVMVVLGTRPEYFNAVWVRNEWSRYLALVKNSGGKKILIPAYKDMDPYDLPEEFSHLQAQDMSKLGFMQDLIRGIKKIIGANEQKATVKETLVVNAGSGNTAPLLKRVFMFLEDENWQEADEYCEKVLDIDPECAEAYLGKLMAEKNISRRESLASCNEPFDTDNNYQKAIRFGYEKLKAELGGYINQIKVRNENARLTGIYNNAQATMRNARCEQDYRNAAWVFKSISDFMDSAKLAEHCKAKAEEARKDAIYNDARSKMTSKRKATLNEAIKLFQTISGWRDADERICACKRKIEEAAREEAERLARAKEQAKKRKKALLLCSIIIIATIAVGITVNEYVIPNIKYNNACALMQEGRYEEAIKEFELLGDSNKIKSRKYKCGVSLMDSEKYAQAVAVFTQLGSYKDSGEKVKECKNAMLDKEYEQLYNEAISLLNSKQYSKAINIFEKLNGYKDSNEKIKEANDGIFELTYATAIDDYNEGRYDVAKKNFERIKDYKDSAKWAQDCDNHLNEIEYQIGLKYYSDEVYELAYRVFDELGTYKDSKAWMEKSRNGITDKLQNYLNANKYEDFEKYANKLAPKLWTGLSFSMAQSRGLFLQLTSEISTDTLPHFFNEISSKESLLKLISDYRDAKNVLRLLELYRQSRSGEELALFKNNMKEFTGMWSTPIIKKLFTSDDIVAFYLFGDWHSESGFYFDFYHNDESSWSNAVSIKYNLPHPDVQAAYYDIQDSEVVYTDKEHNVVAKVFRIVFVDANTISVYCYKNLGTYTLTRTIY